MVPFIVITMIFNSFQGNITTVIFMAMIVNIITMILVLVAGTIFVKSLAKAFEGSYIKNVRSLIPFGVLIPLGET